jgi:Ca2+-binding RTX toxin-like protein
LTGNGSSQISLDGAQAQSIVITTGAGDDTVLMARTIADAFFASLGAGNDTLDTSGGANTITSFVAFGGGGNDTFLGNVSNIFKHEFLFLIGHIS